LGEEKKRDGRNAKKKRFRVKGVLSGICFLR
jgi:hypothetical protein